MENWDDLRIVTYVARLGSFSAASKALAMDHSTVLRRVRNFEKLQGLIIFQKSNRGLVLTEAGERLLPLLNVVEEQILGLERQLKGHNQNISGDLVITTTDAIACTVLPVCIKDLRRLHPELNISINISNALANLNRAEADIAIRPTMAPPESYIGRKLGHITFQFFSSATYLESLKLEDPSQLFHRAKVIAYDYSLAELAASKWLEPQLVPGNFIRTNSVLMASTMAAQGMGCAVIPKFIARFIPGLVAIDGAPEIKSGDLWILAHRDLMKMRRISATFSHLAELIPAIFFG